MANSSTIVRPPDASLRAALRLALFLACIKLSFQFACTLWSTHLGYGYFRDEFYYIACGRHPAWGFVDHGPIVAVQARIGELLFGDSIFAIRILSAVAGAFAIALTGLITWALGGPRRAQVLAMCGLMVAGVYIGTDGYLSMNSCEAVFWMFCIFALLRMQAGASAQKWWLLFGISAGLGLLNKPSMAFFLTALGLALLCTPQRRLLFTRDAAIGIALLILIALPNLLWQVHNHWPTLEFLRNGRDEGKNVVLAPVQFTIAQCLQMGPWNVLLWVTGIVALLRSRSIRDRHWLGLTYLFFFAIMLALHGKDYYLAPIYPFLFAAGAVAWQHRFAGSSQGSSRPPRRWVVPTLAIWLVFHGLVTLPFAAPILAPEAYVRYAIFMHFQPKETETGNTAKLPQFYADRFGWEELTTNVVHVYQSLSPGEQAHACILTNNYGEAGAIQFLAPRLFPSVRLPPVISGHNNYFFWGDQGCDGNLLIAVVGDTPAEVHEHYSSVRIATHLDNPWTMPYEHKNIYIAQGRITSPWLWEERKHFD